MLGGREICSDKGITGRSWSTDSVTGGNKISKPAGVYARAGGAWTGYSVFIMIGTQMRMFGFLVETCCIYIVETISLDMAWKPGACF